MSPKMPEFNIFIITGDAPKKEEKKKKEKENLLAKALKRSEEKDDEMVASMKHMARKVGGTSHVGGG